MCFDKWFFWVNFNPQTYVYIPKAKYMMFIIVHGFKTTQISFPTAEERACRGWSPTIPEMGSTLRTSTIACWRNNPWTMWRMWWRGSTTYTLRPTGFVVRTEVDCLKIKKFSFCHGFLFIYLAFTCIQPKREADAGVAAPAGVRPRWWYNAVTGTCEQFMWDPWDEKEVQSPNNFKTREHCESYCRDSELFLPFYI